jgi:hypothetical protein
MDITRTGVLTSDIGVTTRGKRNSSQKEKREPAHRNFGISKGEEEDYLGEMSVCQGGTDGSGQKRIIKARLVLEGI